MNAGPAALPEEVLLQAQADLLDYHGCGMSVMEMSHRSKEFKAIIEAAEADLRDLLAIPANYRVLFMQGGGTGQFAAVPMNLMRHGVADYVVSGTWSKKACAEAAKYGQANVVASSADANFSYTPDCSALSIDEQADYVYICQNETIGGTRFSALPNTQGKPLVADVSSCFLSEPMDVSRYGVIYGGVQKNVAPAGVVIAIVRDDLIGDSPALPCTPTVLSYKVAADNASLYNTPPCWNIYLCGLVFQWIKQLGGLEAMAHRNQAKADLLYGCLDASRHFRGIARADSRSLMNVTFTSGDEAADADFVAFAKDAGIVGVKGHRSVGGLRASIYNAVTLDGVQSLVDCIERFEASYGWTSRPSEQKSI